MAPPLGWGADAGSKGEGLGATAAPVTRLFLPSQEKQDKAVLQAEVQHLRQDNRRLQEESQTAAAQLRKFTEWFFNTIDKKS